MEIWELGAVELAAALRDRELSAVAQRAAGAVRERVEVGDRVGCSSPRSRMQTDDNELTPKARAWIDAIRCQFQGIPHAPAAAAERPHDALASKGMRVRQRTGGSV
jgi:hypothetical protein